MYGQPTVESVALQLLLSVMSLAPDDHNIFEHPEGNRLQYDICLRVLLVACEVSQCWLTNEYHLL